LLSLQMSGRCSGQKDLARQCRIIYGPENFTANFEGGKIMKKLAVFALIFCFIFSLAGCSGNQEVPAAENEQKYTNQESPAQNEEEPKPEENQTPQETEAEAKGQREELLAEANAGKMTGIDIALGTQGEQVTAVLGEPELWDFFAGGTFLSYDDVVFFCTIDWEDEENPHGEVVRIVYMGSGEVYGLNPGMNPEDVRTLLGEPDETYQDLNGDDEFYFDNLVWTYTAGENYVDVVFDSAYNLLTAIHLVSTAD